MKVLGRHLIVEYTDCDTAKLDDLEHIRDSLLEAVRRSGATIIDSVFHRYAPQGVSGVVVIAESHMSIHTWPEYNYAAVDFFTCGQTVDPHLAKDFLGQALGNAQACVTEMPRGIPSSSDEILNHKPTDAGSRAATAG